MNPAQASHDEILPPRAPWSRVLRRGQTLRLIDLEGTQAVDALFYRADDPGERYSAQDTLRAPEQTSLSRPRRQAAVERGLGDADDHGRQAAAVTTAPPGAAAVRATACASVIETRYMRSCRENFLTGAQPTWPQQAGRGQQCELLHERADRAGRRAWRSSTACRSRGTMSICAAEMDVLCVFSNCPQVNNPCNGFNPTPVRILIWDA